MKELGKWQAISFISRGLAMVLGIIQSFAIIRILTVAEWGTVQLAVSIGGALGIYQHLGLASASTREISTAKSKGEVFKIFLTSVLIRYVISLPIIFGLFFFSERIAVDFYKNPEIIIPMKIYAVSLFFQGFQSILNSVVMGMKRFKFLFTYQVAISAISIAVYIPLVLSSGVNGYFYAFLLFNIINTIILGYMAYKPLKGSLSFPDRKDFKRLFKEIFSISIGIYIVKIIYTNWEKLGGTLLGLFNSAEIIGIYAFGLLYAKKIMTVSDAVTDVNLPVLSEKYSDNVKEFTSLFAKNFDKIFAFIIISSAAATYWSAEIIRFVVGGSKYDESLPIIPYLILAFVIYSYINIITSSVLIPSKMVKEMVISFVFLLLSTIMAFIIFIGVGTSTAGLSWSMAFGSLTCLIYMIWIIRKKLKFGFFNRDHFLIILQGFFIGWSGLFPEGLLKLVYFIVLEAFLFWGLSESGLVTIKELKGMGTSLLSAGKKRI